MEHEPLLAMIKRTLNLINFMSAVSTIMLDLKLDSGE